MLVWPPRALLWFAIFPLQLVHSSQFPFLDDFNLFDLPDWERKFIFGNEPTGKHMEVARVLQETWHEQQEHSGGPPGPDLSLTLETGLGSQLRLSLRRRLDVVSPAFKVVVRGASGAEERRHVPLPLCLFSGEVTSGTGGRAALSTCGTHSGGLRGVVVTPDTHYILHPFPQNLRMKREVDNMTSEGLHILMKGPSFGICGLKNITRMLPPRMHVHVESSTSVNEMTETCVTHEDNDVSTKSATSIDDVTTTTDSTEVPTTTEESTTQPNLTTTATVPTTLEDSVASTPQFNTTIQEEDISTSTSEVPPTSRETHSSKRVKRKVGPRTIEVAVFVDDVMYSAVEKQYPKEEPTNKIVDIVFTMINAVELLYNLPSLGIPFRLVLLRIDILTRQAIGSKPNKRGGEVESYLSSFCHWQRALNPGSDRRDPNHWDHALLLTGLNLYDRVPSADTVIGLAWVSGMCLPAYSCTINEGISFESVYVIAHEMGHNLGMRHDGQNTCDENIYIMSPSLGPGKVTWSPCSKAELESFLNTSQTSCLDDQANPNPKLRHTQGSSYPGERYPALEQCQYAFGRQFSPYVTKKSPFEDICRELWCQNRTYALRAHPALDGTNCGTKKICVGGKCLLDNRVRNGGGKGPSSTRTTKSPSGGQKGRVTTTSTLGPRRTLLSPTKKSVPNSAPSSLRVQRDIPGKFVQRFVLKMTEAVRQGLKRLVWWP